jgi:hypothetical protein
VVAATEEGAALLISYGNFRALIPNGVASEEIAGEPASLLLLGEVDLKAGGWDETEAVLVAAPDGMKLPNQWNDRQVAADPGGWVEAATDGKQLWLEQGK